MLHSDFSLGGQFTRACRLVLDLVFVIACSIGLVIIKGTQIYDSSKGSFVDLSVLDVLQVFGRAGRPGLETSGEGYICTTGDKLKHYLDAVTSQVLYIIDLLKYYEF